MKQGTKRLLDQIRDAHDWESGQSYSKGGTTLLREDVCACCGLTRKWFSDSQNGIEDRWTFSGAFGEPLTLLQASRIECACNE